ncbi:penicillin-binding protein 1C, partial [Xanthobacter autotrophicus]
RLPPPQRHFGRARQEQALEVVYPPDGARVAAEGAETLALKVDGGTFPLTLLMDGRPVARVEDRRTLFWTPPGRGFARLTVIDADGRSDSVTVKVE